MKRLTISLLAALMAAVVVASPVAAQEKKGGVPVKVAIINIDQIMRQAAVANDIRKQHKTFRSDFQATIQKEEEALRTANQELARQRALLTPEAFAEERRKFEQRLMDVQQRIQKRKHDLEKAQREAMKKVQAALNQIVIEIANKESLTLIFNAKQVVFHAKALDVTPLALKQLDAKLPSVKLEIPKAG